MRGLTLASLAGVAFASPAIAGPCPAVINAVEAQRQIPRGLLMAIAITESGMKGEPQPTAMNIAGRAYFAQSTNEMRRIIDEHYGRGQRSIDVGCMQVNLKHHAYRFERVGRSKYDLLDISTNVNYAATFLIELAIDAGSWREAVMNYHNKSNQARRRWYGCKVWNNYLRISGAQTGFLQCGRAPQGSSTASGSQRPEKVNKSPLRLAGYNAPASIPIQPLQSVTAPRPASSATTTPSDERTVTVGGYTVVAPTPKRPLGRVEMGDGVEASSLQLGDGDAAPSDPRAGAFRPIRPTYNPSGTINPGDDDDGL